MNKAPLEKRLLKWTNELIKKYPFLKDVKQEISKNPNLYFAFKSFDSYIKNLEDTIFLQKKEHRDSANKLSNIEIDYIKNKYEKLQPKPL